MDTIEIDLNGRAILRMVSHLTWLCHHERNGNGRYSARVGHELGSSNAEP